MFSYLSENQNISKKNILAIPKDRWSNENQLVIEKMMRDFIKRVFGVSHLTSNEHKLPEHHAQIPIKKYEDDSTPVPLHTLKQ